MEDVRKEVNAVTEQREEARQKVSALEKELEALNAQKQQLKVCSCCNVFNCHNDKSARSQTPNHNTEIQTCGNLACSKTSAGAAGICTNVFRNFNNWGAPYYVLCFVTNEKQKAQAHFEIAQMLQERADKHKAKSAATIKQVQSILRSFSSDKTSLEDARQQLQALKQEAQNQRDATKQKFGDSAGSETKTFQPKVGDYVRLLNMKGAQAAVDSFSDFQK